MARIRTVKPDYFRHEGLQELNQSYPNIMLFFAGLWCQCDKAGHFRWKPNQIKLDVLPFTEYNPSTYLEVLESNLYLSRYEVEGEWYGEILNFKKHQLIWGSEVKSPLKHPLREKEVLSPNRGSTEDIGVRNQELGVRRQDKAEFGPWFSDSLFVEAWKAWSKARKSTPPDGAYPKLVRLSGSDLTTAIKILNESAENGWKGLFPLKGTNGTNKQTRSERLNADAEQFLRDLGGTPESGRSPAKADSNVSGG